MDRPQFPSDRLGYGGEGEPAHAQTDMYYIYKTARITLYPPLVMMDFGYPASMTDIWSIGKR
jgi:hypothetical protein